MIRVVFRAERSARTDADGKLRVDGILPGLQYLIRDGRFDTSQREWTTAFKTTLTLIPIGGTKEAGAVRQVVLDKQLAIRATQPDGKVIAIKSIRGLSVYLPDGRWNLGAPAEILGRTDDGYVLVDRQQLLLARPGYKCELLFEPEQGKVCSCGNGHV